MVLRFRTADYSTTRTDKVRFLAEYLSILQRTFMKV